MPNKPNRKSPRCRKINSRDKGKRGELAWRDVLRAAGWPAAERGQQRAGGADAPDVRGGPPGVHWEVKFVEALQARKALEQATRDSGSGRPEIVEGRHFSDFPSPVPVVAWKTSRAPWVCILHAADLLRLLRVVEVARILGFVPGGPPTGGPTKSSGECTS